MLWLVMPGLVLMPFYTQFTLIYTPCESLTAAAIRPIATTEEQWATRGYDDYGRPLCQFGYALNSYGFDRERQRHKWCCDKTCLHGKDPCIKLAQVIYPPSECPYQTDEHQHGRVINVGEAFTDASTRLARDIPMGSPTWKAFYHRARNAVEGRNATFEN